MAEVLGRGAPWPGVAAVSGGGDSLALMFLLADWARAASKPPPVVLTVDHGLSAESERVARDVLRRAKAAGLKGELLVWKDKKPKADIEAVAREARYRLIGDWCRANKINGVYAAHTLEDQAETFLLRLGRGSGLDGLSAMRPVALYPVPRFDDLRVVRPLLGMGREQLRNYLQARKEAWAEDPMNVDPRFARVRLREAWPLLENSGSPVRESRVRRAIWRGQERRSITRPRICCPGHRASLTARRCSTRRVWPQPLAKSASGPSHGCCRASPANPIGRVSSGLERLFDAICRGELVAARTLHGCLIAPAGKAEAAFGVRTIVIARESPTKTCRPGAQLAAVTQLTANLKWNWKSPLPPGPRIS
jgi:tRNA(Ile)-lysidine synthase